MSDVVDDENESDHRTVGNPVIEVCKKESHTISNTQMVKSVANQNAVDAGIQSQNEELPIATTEIRWSSDVCFGTMTPSEFIEDASNELHPSLLWKNQKLEQSLMQEQILSTYDSKRSSNSSDRSSMKSILDELNWCNWLGLLRHRLESAMLPITKLYSSLEKMEQLILAVEEMSFCSVCMKKQPGYLSRKPDAKQYCMIRTSGGAVATADCIVKFPENSFGRTVEVKLSCFFPKKVS